MSKQRIDDNPPDNKRQATPQRRHQPHHSTDRDRDRHNRHHTTHTSTPQHTTSTPQAHLHLQRRYRSTSFKWHEVWAGTPRQLISARSGQFARASQSCVYREPREMCEERDTRREREREVKRERGMWREREMCEERERCTYPS